MVVDALLTLCTPLIGITDADRSRKGSRLMGIGVLGGDDVLADYPPEAVDLVLGVGSAGVSTIRQMLFENLKAAGYRFQTFVHPTATVSRHAVLGEGCQVMAGAVVQADARLGANVLVNTRVCVDHDCSIGDHVHLGPGSVLCAGVDVGVGSHLGSGSTTIQGVRIGRAVQVGAGAAIIRNCADGTCHVGVPARERRA